MLQCTAEFRDRLQLAMDVREMRAVDLAKKIDVSEATISLYRSGKASPKAERLGQIARVLKVSPAWLMGLDVPMERDELSNDERKIINAYRHMSVVEKRMACQLFGIQMTDKVEDLPFE